MLVLESEISGTVLGFLYLEALSKNPSVLPPIYSIRAIRPIRVIRDKIIPY